MITDTAGQMVYSTYLGGSSTDEAAAIGLDQSGTVVIGGRTISPNFPLVSPLRSAPSIGPVGTRVNDGFVTKLNPQGTAWSYSTYVGGSSGSTVSAMAVVPSGEVYVAGINSGPGLPLVSPIPPTPLNERGGYISQLNANGSALLFSTFFGLSTSSPIADLALDAAGNLYLTASGSPAIFPTLNPIPLPGTNRGTDVLVAKISATVADLAITMADRPDPVQVNGNLSYELTVTNNGLDAATDVTVTDVLPDGVTFVSASASRGSCSGARTVTCALGSLALQASATVTIRVTPAIAGTLTNRASVNSTVADGDLTNNSAEQQTKVSVLPSIFGRITTGDGQGLSGVTVSLSPPFRAATTASDGGYQFGELAAGANYTVTPVRPGFTFLPANRTFDNLTSDQRADFTALRCSFTVTPPSVVFTATGGAGSLTVTASDAACTWTARSAAPWIRLTSGSSGTGSGAVIFTVEPTTTGRRGEIVVANQVIPVRQEFNVCPQAEFQGATMILNDGLNAGELPRFVVADFNGDGRGDPAVLTMASGSGGLILPLNLTIAFSNTSGGYSAPTTVLGATAASASATIPASLAAGDFNRDGKPDLAVTRQDRVVVLLNTSTGGNGSFAAPVEIPLNQELQNIFTGDFTQDGNPDIVCGAVGGFPPADKNVIVLPGNGAGGFGAPIITLFIRRAGDPPQMQPGDFNGDGRLDIAVQQSNNEITILRGNGAGGFEPQPGIPGNTSPAQVPNRLATGDFNADGRSDIVVLRPSTDPEGRSIAIYRSTGNGFEIAGIRALAIDGWIGGLMTADLNGDGRSEVLIQGRSILEVVGTFENGSPLGGLGYSTPLVKSAANPGAPLTFAVGDFNGDGRPDVFVPVPVGGIPDSSAPTAFAVLEGNGSGGFDVPRGFALLSLTEPANSINVLAVADFNGDRVSDVLVRVVRATGVEIVVRFGNGAGGFAAQAQVSIAGNQVFLGADDYNRDGKPDIALLNATTGFMAIYAGEGFYRLSGPISVGPNARLLATGDFTSDGNPDFLFAVGNNVRLFAGKGDATFNDLAASVTGSLTNVAFTPGDFNGDGNLDLLALTPPPPPSTAAIVSVLFGDGQGRFSGELAQAVLAQQPQIRVADFNDDGKSDLAIATLSVSQGATPGILIALSRGNGQFGPTEGFVSHDILLAAPQLQSLSVGDVNGDGLADLLAITRTSNQLLVYTAQSPGQFRSALSFPTGESAPPLPFVGDFNGDGAPDVLRVVPTSGGASLLLNRGSCAPAGALTVTSAASFNRLRMAGDSIAAAFGVNLANEVVVATTTPLPTTLGGTTLRIRDSVGVELDAPLFFVSPQQINLLIPRGLANGPAVVTVRRGGAVVATGIIEIVAVNPGLLSADASGTGYAAAVVLRVKADGSQVYEPVVQFNASQNRFDPVPIDVSNPAEQVFVLLFGTGLRNRSSLSNVSLRIGGEAAETLYAGDQGGFAGLDQLNVRLLPNLAGRGDVNVELTVDGKVANTVRLRIR